MKSGAAFERLIHEYYDRQRRVYGRSATLTLGDWAKGPDGLRQCDITIEHRSLGITYRTLVECKDYSRNVPILHVDALVSKLADLKFNKGIIVARSGFQSGAIAKAERLGIDLYTFDQAKHHSKMKPDIPVLHLVMEVPELSLTFNAEPDIYPPLLGLTQRLSQEVDVDQFIAEWVRPDTRQLSGYGHKRISPTTPLSLQSTSQVGAAIFIIDHVMRDVDLYLRYNTKAYLGTLSQVEEYYIHESLSRDEWNGFIPANEIGQLVDRLPFFNDTGEIPTYLFQGGFVTYTIQLAHRYRRQGLYELASQRAEFNSRFAGLYDPRGKWLSVHVPVYDHENADHEP